MSRAELLRVLAVERFAPSPRPPLTGRYDAPAPITPEQAERNRAALAEALGGDLRAVEAA